MLARVTKGKDGVVDYLVNGMKSGRDFSRNDLDHRVCIDGNLDVTDKIIKQMNREGRDNNYLHITLSFGEMELSRDAIVDAYGAYKESIMNAYHPDEYNVYAEIHYPKIKSYVNKKTDKIVERLPHVHIVIPKKNLTTGKTLEPFGRYTDNIKYHDAIQESVNRTYGLESPYDHQRKYRMNDDSEFISRYKGDTFTGSKSAFKKELFDEIESKNIRSMSDFEKMLSSYGDVSKGKAGSPDEYLKIKLAGESKNIRLTEPCFKKDYINERVLLRTKPTDKAISKLVNEWRSIRSHEVKHIHPSSPKTRATYYNLSSSEQKTFINERRADYDRQFNLISSRRETSQQSSFERARPTRFADISNGLPSVPQRSLVRTRRERAETTKSILPNHEHNYLESRRSSGNYQLRWTHDDRRRRGGITTGLPTNNEVSAALQKKNDSVPLTLSEQLLKDHMDQQSYQKELRHFRVIKKTLEPDRLLNHLKTEKGLIKSHYKTFRLKDGTPRIRIDNRSFNVSDFCTQHMHMPWDETKKILTRLHHDQNRDKEERNNINSITFISDYVTSSYVTDNKLSRLDESIMILKYLQRKEKYEEKTMAATQLKSDTFSKNTITSEAEIGLTALTERFKRQKELQERLSMNMGDLVSVKKIKEKKVEFIDKNTGDKVFVDEGERIVLNSRKPTDDHVVTAMTLAAEKFGKVSITGTKEFKQQVIDAAVVKNLKITFKSPEMQDLFIKSKKEFQKQNNENTTQQSEQKKEVNAIEKEDSDKQSHSVEEPSKVAAKEKVEKSETEADQTQEVNTVGNNQEIKDDDLRKDIKENKRPEMEEKNSDKTQQSDQTQEVNAIENKGNKQEIKNDDIHKDVQENKIPEMEETNVSPEQNEVRNRDSVSTENLPFLVKHGKAPFHNKDSEKQSYFIEMSDGVTKWGVGLEKALKESGAKIGDTLDIQRVGKKDIQVDVQNNDGDIVKKDAYRTEWEINVVDKKNNTFTTAYDWNAPEQKLQLTINGGSPAKISDEILKNIMANDKYLNDFTLDEVKNGMLDLKKSDHLFTGKVFNEEGEVVVNQQKSGQKASQ